MARKPWFPANNPDRLTMFQNVVKKIGDYTVVLPITVAQQTRIELICDTFVAAYTYVEQTRATTQSLVDWRNNIFEGDPAGDPAPAAPAFGAVSMPVGAFIGIFDEFREMRELIVASPGYTQAIGEDLMIVGTESEELVEQDVIPNLKVSVSTGYKVSVAASLQGMDAMRVEYKRNGASGSVWSNAAFLTKLPAEFTITPQTPGEPESGHIRAVFIKKNEEFGQFSPEYPITVS
jgi:hypothetical protein